MGNSFSTAADAVFMERLIRSLQVSNFKISIITVVYNAADTIEQTIRSVVEQDYPNIEYIIIDGGSTDGTLDVIKKYEDRIAYWVSEPDKGLYDALTKGFERVTGDICAYINADDFYQPHAFAAVCSIFKNVGCRWLTGINAVYNVKGQIVAAKIPFRYRAAFIQKGYYNGKYLPFIQQESTFWTTDLLKLVDFARFRMLRLAGDYYLWKCFSTQETLSVASCLFAGFRKRRGQLSEAQDAYMEELRSFCAMKPNVWEKAMILLDRLMGGFPTWFNPTIIRFDFQKERWGVYEK